MVKRDSLVTYLNDYLDVGRFQDSCLNGLQVEGGVKIRTIVTGVTANTQLFQAAVRHKAQAVLVHHGLFWGKEFFYLKSFLRMRVAFLLKHDLNLLVYHLPLDAHPKLGNAVALIRFLHMKILYAYDVGFVAEFQGGLLIEKISSLISEKCGIKVKHVFARKDATYKRFVVLTGGTFSYMKAVFEMNVDGFITGEVSERVPAYVQETGKAFIALGHYDSERFGVQALGKHVAKKFDLQHQFIHIPNEF